MPDLQYTIELDASQAIKQGAQFETQIQDIESVFSDFEQTAKVFSQGLANSLSGDVFNTFSQGAEKAVNDAQSAFNSLTIPNIEAPQIDAPNVGFIEDLEKQLTELKAKQKQAFTLEDAKAYQVQISKVEEELKGVAEELVKVAKQGSKSGSLLENIFSIQALGQVGTLLDGIADKGGDAATAEKTLAAATGLVGDALDEVEAAGERAFKRGVGENIAEAQVAIGKATQQLKNFLSPQEIEDFTVQAAGIGKTFDKEVGEVVGGGRTLIANFGLSGKEAGDLISLGMQQAGSKMDDLLDTTDEYSQLAKVAGFSAEEFIGTLTTGIQAGARDTDKLADAIKETQIRLNAGDIGTALSSISSPVTATLQAISDSAAAGDITVKEMLQKSAQAIEQAFDAGQISSAMRSQLQVAVSGTPAEDIGSELYGKIFGAPIDTAAISAKAAEAGAQIAKVAAPTNVFQSLQKEAEAALTDVASFFAPAISGAGGLLSSVGQIGPGVAVLQDKFNLLDKGGKVFDTLKAGALKFIPALTLQTAATGGATAAQTGLNLAMLANPIGLIIGGLAVATGLFFAFGGTVEDITDTLEDAWGAFSNFLGLSSDAEEENRKAERSIERANEAYAEFTENIGAADSALQSAQGTEDLIAKYDALSAKTTLTAAEQAELASVTSDLVNQFPDAVGGVDDLTGAYSLNIEKAKELSKESLEFANGERAKLIEENLIGPTKDLAAAQEAQKSLLAELREELDEAIASGDSEEILEARDAYEKQREAIKGVDEQLKKNIQSLKDTGSIAVLSAEEVANATGLTLGDSQKAVDDLIKSYVQQGLTLDDITKKTGLSSEAIKKLVPNVKLLANETKRAAQSAQDMGKQYADALSKSDAAVQANINAILAKRQEFNKATTKADKDRIAEEIKGLEEASKTEQAKLNKDAKDREQLEIRLGRKQAQQGQSAFEKKMADIDAQAKAQQTKIQENENVLAETALAEYEKGLRKKAELDQKEQQEVLKQQIEATRAQIDALNAITRRDKDGAIIGLTVASKPGEAAKNLQDVKSRIADLNRELADQKGNLISLKAELDPNSMLRIRADFRAQYAAFLESVKESTRFGLVTPFEILDQKLQSATNNLKAFLGEVSANPALDSFRVKLSEVIDAAGNIKPGVNKQAIDELLKFSETFIESIGNEEVANKLKEALPLIQAVANDEIAIEQDKLDKARALYNARVESNQRAADREIALLQLKNLSEIELEEEKQRIFAELRDKNLKDAGANVLFQIQALNNFATQIRESATRQFELEKQRLQEMQSEVENILTQSFSAAFDVINENFFQRIDEQLDAQENAFGAFSASLVKAIITTGQQMIAQYIAHTIASALFTASITAQMNAIAASAATAAALVSTATFGGAALAGGSALAATVALAQGLAIPKFAEGGRVSTPTLAWVGEEFRPELILPEHKVDNILKEKITDAQSGAIGLSRHDVKRAFAEALVENPPVPQLNSYHVSTLFKRNQNRMSQRE